MVGFSSPLDPSSPPPSALVQLPPISSPINPDATSSSPTQQTPSAIISDEQMQTRLLLSHYDSSLGAQGKLPPLSRIDPQKVQKKPPAPLRFGFRSISSSRADSGAGTPTRREGSAMGQGRRRSSQQTEGNTPTRTTSQSLLQDGGNGSAEGSSVLEGRPDPVYHPDHKNDDLTPDDRRALGAQRLDEQLAPNASTSTAFHPVRRSSDSEDEDDEERTTGEAVSETAKGLIRWVYDNWYDFGWMLGKKGFDIGWSLVKYGVKGGPKKSWGIEMTLVAAIMRNLSAHSSLADITLVRNLISIHHLLPLPPDAIVTPITFKIRKRGKQEALRGFLSELDELNTGNRELSGEWVVNKTVWARLKAEKMERDRKKFRERERRGAGQGRDSPLDSSRDQAGEKATGEKIIYYIHGGAYYVGQAATHRLITIALSKACNARVFALNYRLAPESRFPEPLLDVVYGYFRLVESLNIDPSNILVMGDSAGGGLSLALAMYLRDAGYRHLLPRALVLMSPWVDLTMSCGSWDENAPFDVVPQPGQDDHLNPVACYLGPEGIKQYLTHPYASPLFGDFNDLPPMLIQAGDSEVLRDEITLLAHKAAMAGVRVKHEMYVDQVHVFQSFPFLDAAHMAFRSIAKFAATVRDSARILPEVAVNNSTKPTNGVPLHVAESSVSRSSTPTDIDTVASEMEHGKTKLVKGDGTEIDIGTLEETPDENGQVPLPKSGNGESSKTSKTPTNLPAPKPILRRAFSSFSRGSTPPLILTALPKYDGAHTTGHSPVDLKISELNRGPTTPPINRGTRRSRRPTLSSQLTLSPAKPTTRLRSGSHADMIQLMTTYSAGAANQTTVYSPAPEMNPFDGPLGSPADGDGSRSDIEKPSDT